MESGDVNQGYFWKNRVQQRRLPLWFHRFVV
jgi:hypothetical protein